MASVLDEAEEATTGNSAIDESRRDQIVDAADDLLSEEGLDALTIRAVLRRTGLARRALYESFGGKDDLVLAVFERVLKRATQQFNRLLSGVDYPLDRVRVIVVSIVLGPFGVSEGVEVDRRSAAFSREHLRLAEARPADLAHALGPLLELIASEVAAGMRDGSVRDGDPMLAARLIYNLVATTTHTELLTPEHSPNRADRQMLADAIWEFCRRAIAA
jgi:AcrR family transcriptional regulator